MPPYLAPLGLPNSHTPCLDLSSLLVFVLDQSWGHTRLPQKAALSIVALLAPVFKEQEHMIL